jgi:hypothetical protein
MRWPQGGRIPISYPIARMRPCFFALILFFIIGPLACDAEERAWRSKSGSSITGSIIAKSEESVTIKKADGSPVTVPLAQLSLDDQAFAAKWSDPVAVGLIYFSNFDLKSVDDLSGKNNHGIATGTTSGAPRPGKSGYSRNFDGKDDCIRLPIDINGSAFPQLTICVWAKPARNLRMGKIVSNDDGGYDRTLGVDKRGAEGAGDFQWVAFSGSGKVLGSEEIKSLDGVFLAVIYDQRSQEVTLFVDDRKYSKKGGVNTGHRFTNIGSNPSHGDFFDGTLDDLRIYGRALSDEEISIVRAR